MKYKYALIDADNTIFDFDKSEKMAIYKTFEKYNIVANDEVCNYYHIVNDMYWKKLERKEVTHEELAVNRFLDVFSKFGYNNINPVDFDQDYKINLSKQSYLLDGAYQLLEYLHSTLDKLIISSNGSSFIQHNRVKNSTISPFIYDIYTSQDAGVNKPSTLFFDRLFDKYQIDKDKTVLIGDSLTADIKGGYDYNIDTIFYSPNNVKCDIATYTVNNLLDIKDIIK